MSNPLVAGLISNYNYGRFIMDALTSLAQQTYDNLKIFIVDDCSADNSIEILTKNISDLKLVKNINGVYLISKGSFLTREVYVIQKTANNGRAANRNDGINVALSLHPEIKAIANCDADDLYHPTKIAKSMEILKINPLEIGSVYSDYTSWNIDDNIKIREYKPPFSVEALQGDCIINNDSVFNVLALQKIAKINQSGRREFYCEELTTAEDYLMHLQIAKSMVSVHIPEDLLTVRVHKNNSTFAVDRSEWERNWARLRQLVNG